MEYTAKIGNDGMTLINVMMMVRRQQQQQYKQNERCIVRAAVADDSLDSSGGVFVTRHDVIPLRARRLQVFIVVGQSGLLCFLEILLDAGLPLRIHGDLWR
uniref:Uncharacterized protein n=1 Tax=Cacopsylla melanoneura TaxID=428564 RepID=A0A8D8S0F5_9HEMI